MKGGNPNNSGSPPFLFPYCSAICPQNGKNRIYVSNSPSPFDLRDSNQFTKNFLPFLM